MKKIIGKFFSFLNLVKIYIFCLFGSIFFMAIIMFFIIAVIESKNKQRIYYLNFSNPSFRILTVIIIFLTLILSIILYARILAQFKKLDKK
ncbi:MAG: hypothetical protein QG630_25 [Patescibacteria group bacterium]|nr:hypothetical protein [Patescibacteria group bacterium]